MASKTSHSQLKVICLYDAAVSQAANLSGSGKLNKSGWVCSWPVDSDSYSYALFSANTIAVAGRDIPDAPRYALQHLLALSVWRAAVGKAALLCHAAQF